MTPELWKKVSAAWEEYFNLAADSRAEFLQQLHSSDAEVAAELETLLRQHDGSEKLKLDAPPSALLEEAGQSRPKAEAAGPVTVDHDPESVQSARDASTVPPAEDSAFDRAKTATRLPAGVPAKAGRYVIEEKIGEGGMGAVLRVRDPDFDRTLAVKIMSAKASDDADAQRRFLQEAKITGQLQHPGIPPVHEIGQLEDGLPFFAMKLIRGKTLASLLKNRGDRRLACHEKETGEPPVSTAQSDLPRFISIFGQICQTIAYAHSRGIIHRDLKPSNVMVGAFGEVQVMDWGLAKVVNQSRARQEAEASSHVRQEVEPSSRARQEAEQPRESPLPHGRGSDEVALQTRAGTAMGTPAYMAPEQARGEIDQIDARSDVFGLGAILCQILTGRPPFTGDNSRDILDRASRADLSETLERLNQCGADAELIDLTKRCLAPKKATGPRTAAKSPKRLRITKPKSKSGCGGRSWIRRKPK